MHALWAISPYYDRDVGALRQITGDLARNHPAIAGNEEIAADLVVSNADAGHTYDRLLRNQPRKRWTPKKLESRRWSMGLYVWYFGTKGTRDMWKDVGHR